MAASVWQGKKLTREKQIWLFEVTGKKVYKDEGAKKWSSFKFSNFLNKTADELMPEQSEVEHFVTFYYKIYGFITLFKRFMHN